MTHPITYGEPLPLPPRAEWTRVRSGMAYDAMPTSDPSSAQFIPPSSRSTFQPVPPSPLISGAKLESHDQASGGNGGGGITAKQAVQAIRFLRGKLSPQDHEDFVDLLEKLLDGGGEGEGQDEPTRLPAPVNGDEKARAAFNAAWPEVAAIGRDTTGMPVPPSREQRQARLALDGAQRANGSSFDDFAQRWPDAARLIK